MAIRSNWNYPTAVRFGAGRIAELPEALRITGIKKPLFVTDAGLVNLPVTQNALKLLRDAGFEVVEAAQHDLDGLVAAVLEWATAT